MIKKKISMKKLIGQAAEIKARAYLEKHGLVWICSNYFCPQGEIDLIMRDRETLVFVEVRYRRRADYGESVETVARRKQQRLIKTAWHYLLETHQVDKVNGRFDVIGLIGDKIYWIQNAFEVQY